jgi:ERCC4-related helicase
MCDFKILLHDEYGYATHCQECNHIEIAFGTSLVRMPVNRLEAFVKYLNNVKQSTTVDNSNQKKILLDLASMYSFQMILTYQEMTLLCERMEKVEEEVQANALLGLFNC